MSEELKNLLATLPGAAPFEQRGDGLWMDAPDLDVIAAAHLMLDHGARLSTITALALESSETQVIYHYALGGSPYNLCARTRSGSMASITPITPAANWPEREISDLYAVNFAGHPNPIRLVRPPQLQPGYFREPGGAAGKALREQGKAQATVKLA